MRRLQILFIAVFCAVLLFPLLLINTDPSALSLTERRRLATLPSFSNDKIASEEYQNQLGSYFNDRIGLRNEFGVINARIKLFGLRIAPSDGVRIGLNDWYYYTLSNNLQLITGDYPLTDDDLSQIVANQKHINNYYANQDVKYLLMITPSKATVYPEYTGLDYSNADWTAADIVSDAAAEAGVEVVPAKSALLAHKGDGQLFRKIDAHWTDLGAYYAYRAISEKLAEIGIDYLPIEVEVGEAQNQPGDFNRMYGDPALMSETLPTISFQSHATEVTSGDYYDAINDHANSIRNISALAIYENPNATGGTLLIYGDSQERPQRKVPPLLAEHFKRVVYAGIIPVVHPELDALVQPDVVLFASSEYFINPRLISVPELGDLQ